MKIFVITHKKFQKVSRDPVYVPLLVGADHNTGESNYLKDNSIEDNISEKNSSFCELTGAYWIWKSVNEDIVGLCHYRRYFCLSKRLFPRMTILSEKQIKRILQSYDIILPAKNNYEYNNKPSKEFFAENHDPDVWEKCKRIIKIRHQEYMSDFEWFEEETTGYCYNMLIASKDIFDAYHEWLFDILFELEKITDLSKYNNYNTRMYGFVSERLINVWCHHQKLRIKEMPVYNVDSPNILIKISQKVMRDLNKN